MDWNLVILILSSAGAVITAVAVSVWWLASQFRATRDLIYKAKEDILDKLVYHERHDDDRFIEGRNSLQAIKNDIWELRVRNAAKEGISPSKLRNQDFNNNHKQEG